MINKTRRTLTLCAASLTLLASIALVPVHAESAVPAVAVAQTEDQRLMAFFDEVFQRNLKDSPTFQSQLGMKGPDYGKWGDFSDTEATRQNDLTKQDLARLRADFKYDALTDSAKVSYRIFEFLQDRTLRGFPWRFHNYAFSTQNNFQEVVTLVRPFLDQVRRGFLTSGWMDCIRWVAGKG